MTGQALRVLRQFLPHLGSENHGPALAEPPLPRLGKQSLGDSPGQLGGLGRHASSDS